MPIYCSHCSDEIKYKSDLIVTYSFFTFSTFHAECYGLNYKRGKSLTGSPINTRYWILLPAMLFIVYLINLQSPGFRAEPVLHLLSFSIILAFIYQRLYSYYKFEKKLK